MELVDAVIDLQAERPRLMGLAYQMLGTVQDAEDAVQEALSRFYALPETERDAVRKPGAWLMRTTARIGLDTLKSARMQREKYVGEWLPEPLPADAVGADPGAVVSSADSVSQAFLIILESLTPAERAVYVLRESFVMPYQEIAGVVGRSAGACRQLFSSAKRRLSSQTGETRTSRTEQDQAVRAFAAACESGDTEALAKVLDPSVVVRADGGGRVSAARRPVAGLDKVVRLFMGLRVKYPHGRVQVRRGSGALAVVLLLDEEVAGVMTCAVGAFGISDIWIMRHPDKLRFW